jgi:hypothetical protein
MRSSFQIIMLASHNRLETGQEWMRVKMKTSQERLAIKMKACHEEAKATVTVL